MKESIRQVCERVTADGGDMEALVAALMEREESMADKLRVAGANFGLYPQIVAEVLAEVEMGEPISEDQRRFIKAQFVNLMAQLQQQYRDNQ